jgi:hypothetical protein
MSKEKLIAAVRAHAEANYENGGWDYVVEAMDDKDIEEKLEGINTEFGAIKKMKWLVNLLDGHRKEIESTAF